MGNPIVHFSINGKEALKLQEFYGKLFDWKVAAPMMEYAKYGLVDRDSSGLAGGIGESQDGSSSVTLFVEVPDLQAALDEAVKLGGSVVMPPMEMPGIVTMAEFADPNGNVIGLVKAGTY
jgi:predicted enzyme related to lactoylglutathione lyase